MQRIQESPSGVRCLFVLRESGECGNIARGNEDQIAVGRSVAVVLETSQDTNDSMFYLLVRATTVKYRGNGKPHNSLLLDEAPRWNQA